MANGEGATRNGSTITVGDFIYEGYSAKKYLWGLLGDSWKKDKKAYEEKVLELMAEHYEFYGKLQKEDQYVTKDSILNCSLGSYFTRFDILTDHGVADAGDVAIGICTDCTVNKNIYSFGGCKASPPEGYPKRTKITIQEDSGSCEREKCIPMITGEWIKCSKEDLKIWDHEKGEYYDALTTGDYLLCSYGGYIKVAEVKNGFGQPAITNDWLRLYSSPTVSGAGRSVAKHPSANNYDWGMPEELKKNNNPENYSTNSMAATMINAAGGTLIVKKESNNVYTDDEGRYWIAVGPKFMNPNHTSNMKIKPEKMNYGTKIDIHVIGQYDGKDYYIPAVVGDAKEHSKPDGLYQTGVPFDSNRPTAIGDGSSVEFIGYGIATFTATDGNIKSTINYTNDYQLIELIIYDGIVNY